MPSFGGGSITKQLNLVVSSSYHGGLGGARADLGGLSSAAGTAGLALGAAGIAAGAFAIKTAAGFENALTHVKAFAGASDAEIGRYRKAILSMAPTLGLSATNMAEGLYNLSSAGIKGRDAMIALSVGSKAAAASNTDLSTVTDALTTAINSYGLHGKQIKGVMDDMTQATLSGKMEFGDYAASLGQVVPVAKQLGINMKTIGGLFADLTNRGNSTAETSIMLKNVFDQLLAPTTMQRKEMATLGLTMQDFSVHGGNVEATLHRIADAAGKSDNANIAVRKLFGGNLVAMRAFFGLMGDGGKAMHGYLQTMQHDAGVTETSLNKASQSTTFQWNKLKATVEVIAIDFGSKLLPAVNHILGPLLNLTQSVTSNTGWFKKAHDALFGWTETAQSGRTQADRLAAAFGNGSVVVQKHTGLVDDLRQAWDKATNNGKDLRDEVNKLFGAFGDLRQGVDDMLRPLGFLDKGTHGNASRMDALTVAMKGVVWVIDNVMLQPIITLFEDIGKVSSAIGAVITTGERFKNKMGELFSFVQSHNPFEWLAHHIPHISLPGWVTALGGILHGGGGGLGNIALPQTGGGPFGLSNVTGAVFSSTAGESSILGGHTPVADLDYLLPPGSHQPVRLPGGRNLAYQIVSSQNVPGIGGIEQVVGPQGNRFAFLHLAAMATPGAYHGGDVVGVTGWPTDPRFGNGVAGPGNAQLCVVYDSSGNPAYLAMIPQAVVGRMAGRGGGLGGLGGGSGIVPAHLATQVPPHIAGLSPAHHGALSRYAARGLPGSGQPGTAHQGYHRHYGHALGAQSPIHVTGHTNGCDQETRKHRRTQTHHLSGIHKGISKLAARGLSNPGQRTQHNHHLSPWAARGLYGSGDPRPGGTTQGRTSGHP